MEEIDTQALNKKLAEWAGWHDFNQNGCGYPPNSVKDQPRLFPIFTNSLDACFKWLVPKLRDVSINYPSIVHDKPTYLASTWKAGVSYLGYNENPALALCLAISKLIDSEEENATK